MFDWAFHFYVVRPVIALTLVGSVHGRTFTAVSEYCDFHTCMQAVKIAMFDWDRLATGYGVELATGQCMPVRDHA